MHIPPPGGATAPPPPPPPLPTRPHARPAHRPPLALVNPSADLNTQGLLQNVKDSFRNVFRRLFKARSTMLGLISTSGGQFGSAYSSSAYKCV
jgi:hypothetical protein